MRYSIWRSYALLTEDTTRVMARIKAIFRGQRSVARPEAVWPQASPRVSGATRACALRRRAELLYEDWRRAAATPPGQARDDCGVRKYPETKLLCSVPFLVRFARGADRRVQTPHRFRTKRQFWAYCGLALEMRDSGEYRVVDGQVERRKKPAQIRGLNWNHNHELKNLFKAQPQRQLFQWVFREFYLGC